MDTVRMYWQDYHESHQVRQYLDMIGDAEGISKDERDLISPDAIYRDISKYKLDGRYIYLMRSPRYKKLPNCALSFHASKFPNYDQLNDWLMTALGGDMSLLDLATISRLDLCVDVAVDFDYAYQTIRRKRGRKTTIYHSKKGSSIYFGERPLQHVLYEKNVLPQEVDLVPGTRITMEERNKINVLRFEARFFSTQCPVKRWRDIHKVIDIDPFEKLEKLKINQSFISNLTTQKRRSIEAFLYECEKAGYDHAVKMRNKPPGRFKTSIGQYLVDANVNLEKAWENRCARWFKVKSKTTNLQAFRGHKKEVHSGPQ